MTNLLTDRNGRCLYCNHKMNNSFIAVCPKCGYDGTYPITKAPVKPEPSVVDEQLLAVDNTMADLKLHITTLKQVLPRVAEAVATYHVNKTRLEMHGDEIATAMCNILEKGCAFPLEGE